MVVSLKASSLKMIYLIKLSVYVLCYFVLNVTYYSYLINGVDLSVIRKLPFLVFLTAMLLAHSL